MGSKATACLVCQLCYPNTVAIKLLKTGKQKCQQLHQRFTEGKINKRELKDHNDCTCLLGGRHDQNPVCCFLSMRWRQGGECPFPFPVHVVLHRPAHILVLEGIKNGKNLWENYEITAVSFMSNLALPKCMEFLYTGFLQRNLCPVCMPVIDFVKFSRTFHSGSTCVYKGSTVFKVWLFESQSYPVPGKEITKVLPLSFAGYNLHGFVDTTVLLSLCSLLWKY